MPMPSPEPIEYFWEKIALGVFSIISVLCGLVLRLFNGKIKQNTAHIDQLVNCTQQMTIILTRMEANQSTCRAEVMGLFEHGRERFTGIEDKAEKDKDALADVAGDVKATKAKVSLIYKQLSDLGKRLDKRKG